MSRKPKDQPAEPTQPDGLPGKSDAQDKTFIEENPPRTVGEQPSGTPPLDGPSHDDMTRPGADVTIGTPDDRDEADMTDEEFDRLDPLDKRRDARALRYQRPADFDPTVEAKIDPVVGQSNVELPGDVPKVDNGSKERTDLAHDVAAQARQDDPGFAAGYTYAMKQARGEI